MEQHIGIVIVAGGSGRRCGGGIPKQFRFLGMKPVLAHTIERFKTALPTAEIVVVLPEEHIDFWKNLAARFPIAAHRVVAGGTERFFSVRNGIDALGKDVELIAIQDGVRPLCTKECIQRTLDAALEFGAAIPAIQPADSFREVDAAGGSKIIDRSLLRCVQTPQIFKAELLRRAYQASFDPKFTDDASVVEALGATITLVEGERTNLKITTNEDFILANAILEAEAEKAQETK